MTIASTPSEAAYIAANQAFEVGQQIYTIAIIVVAIAALASTIVIWLRWPKQCGDHQFCARIDQVFKDEKWHALYVRDVCTHCGLAVERADGDKAEPPANG